MVAVRATNGDSVGDGSAVGLSTGGEADGLGEGLPLAVAEAVEVLLAAGDRVPAGAGAQLTAPASTTALVRTRSLLESITLAV